MCCTANDHLKNLVDLRQHRLPTQPTPPHKHQAARPFLFASKIVERCEVLARER